MLEVMLEAMLLASAIATMPIPPDVETHCRTLADTMRRPAAHLPHGDGSQIWLRDEEANAVSVSAGHTWDGV